MLAGARVACRTPGRLDKRDAAALAVRLGVSIAIAVADGADGERSYRRLTGRSIVPKMTMATWRITPRDLPIPARAGL